MYKNYYCNVCVTLMFGDNVQMLRDDIHTLDNNNNDNEWHREDTFP